MTTLPIPLPQGFSVIVSPGDEVSAGQVIAHKLAPVEQIVNIPESLSISLSQVKKVMKKSPGDKVMPGDVIAVKKNFFGKQQASIISSIEGTVSRYERSTGNLAIRTDEKETANELISPVAGTIDLCNNKEIVIRTDKAIAGGRVVSGQNNEGEIFILEESFSDKDSTGVLFYLDNRAIGKVVLGGTLTRDVLIKGAGIGTAGFIGTNILDDDIYYLQEKNIPIPVMEIDIESMNKLKEQHGKKVLIDVQNRTVVFLQT